MKELNIYATSIILLMILEREGQRKSLIELPFQSLINKNDVKLMYQN
jgi:hypothetical protein